MQFLPGMSENNPGTMVPLIWFILYRWNPIPSRQSVYSTQAYGRIYVAKASGGCAFHRKKVAERYLFHYIIK
jgi:hypothetical protein